MVYCAIKTKSLFLLRQTCAFKAYWIRFCCQATARPIFQLTITYSNIQKMNFFGSRFAFTYSHNRRHFQWEIPKLTLIKLTNIMNAELAKSGPRGHSEVIIRRKRCYGR